MKVLGVVLIAAAIVVPAVVARMLTNSFAKMLWLSTLIGALCGLVGMYLSYHLDISSGATIVLVGFALFAGVFACTGGSGLRRVGSLDDHALGGSLVAVSETPTSEARAPAR
jgi:manganese/iron transport system permease protein/iron/zinc/copper transport system permease protein